MVSYMHDHVENDEFINYDIIIIIQKGWQCKPGRERLTPEQSEDPNHTIPTHRMKEEKGKKSRRQKGSEQLSQ